MAFLLPKLATPSSCRSPPNPLKPQLVLPSHGGGGAKLHGGSGSAQAAAAPSHLNLNLPLLLSASQQDAPVVPTAKSTETKSRSVSSGGGDPRRSEFYLNLGMAVRTLRDDLPAVFVREPNYDIYREDITFVDPLNTFHGIDNYKTIFWALRFHGRLLFSEIGLDISRIWQLTENSIVVRWELWGTPRVPWESYGCFSGTSRYKVDRNGKIYEHKVDNLALDFPRPVAKVGSIADLVVAAYPPSPNLTFWDVVRTGDGCSWTKLYQAVLETVEREGDIPSGIVIEGLLTCS
ncbi:uncharacterized protein LOC100836831 [Brachypodium distachyon]|uniref:Uncharacterized protein n=1 Tax=Brachypodium distachyon TaxID=15368 RepID=I1J1R6_BRADI|nr:uncharacterized protein LOC100836831 [Brachypodium distachyon]KQJ84554.1 hypothetical protein BRADI_5g21600v3 [Brachypodium distachyon]|eukprot:XP_003580536.1 uncharacterized protein LOC100836831 [Brachypodium distachyon]